MEKKNNDEWNESDYDDSDYLDATFKREENPMIRPLTKKMVQAILYDLLPSGATCIDFGIDPKNPNPTYGALQWGFRHGCFTEEQLDKALGNGPKLTELVQIECPETGQKNPYSCVITTIFDGMKEE